MKFQTAHRLLHDMKLVPLLRREFWGVVLDVGAKHSPYREHMGCASLTTLDIDDSWKPDIIADLHNFKSRKKFDTVTAFQVLEHLHNPDIALQRVRAVLKPRGVFVASVPFLFQKHAVDDFTRWTGAGLKVLFLRAGFETVIIFPYGNVVSVVWNFVNFHNYFGVLNYPIAWLTKGLPSRWLNDGFIVVAVKR